MATKEALGMSLEISQEYIENLTKDLLTQSLIETLDAKNAITKNIVSDVLSVKVDSHGRPSTYSGDANRTFLKYLCEKMIREEVASVAEEVLNDRRSEIRELIKKEISKKATINKMTEVFCSSVIDNISDHYRVGIDFNFTKIEDF